MARNENVLSVVSKSVCVVASQANQHIFVWWKSFFCRSRSVKDYIFMHRVKWFCPICFMGPKFVGQVLSCVANWPKKVREIFIANTFFLQTPSPLLTTIPTFRPPPQTQVGEAGTQAIKTLWDQLSQGPRRHNVSQYQTNFFLFGLL